MRFLEHPAIPKIVDYVEEEEFCYLIMEYIRGQSLGEILKNKGDFSIEETLRLGNEIAKVLEYLHSRKPAVCYGDLKPDNLMLSENGHLYLVDLGSAMLNYERKGRICEGTKGYAAPEQYQGRVSPVSDIFALGKTLQILSGRRGLMFFLYRISGFCFAVRENRRNTGIRIWLLSEKFLKNWGKDIVPLPGENVFWKALA